MFSTPEILQETQRYLDNFLKTLPQEQQGWINRIHESTRFPDYTESLMMFTTLPQVIKIGRAHV